jgi:hypothetical protein
MLEKEKEKDNAKMHHVDYADGISLRHFSKYSADFSAAFDHVIKITGAEIQVIKPYVHIKQYGISDHFIRNLSDEALLPSFFNEEMHCKNQVIIDRQGKYAPTDLHIYQYVERLNLIKAADIYYYYVWKPFKFEETLQELESVDYKEKVPLAYEFIKDTLLYLCFPYCSKDTISSEGDKLLLGDISDKKLNESIETLSEWLK